VVTFAEAIERPGGRWVVIVTIAGDGNSDASDSQYRYCTDVPAYAAGNKLYRPWIAEDGLPDVLSEAVDRLGGIPEAGAVTVIILDGIDGPDKDVLTSTWRTRRAPASYLIAELTVGATTIDVEDGTLMPTAPFLAYVGAECMRVTNVSTDTLTLERAALDSDAYPHHSGDAVYLSPPTMFGRTLRVKLVPHDGDDATEETTIGTFYLDRKSLTEDLCAYVLEGRTTMGVLGKWLGTDRLALQFIQAMTSGRIQLGTVGPPPRRLATVEGQVAALDPWATDEALILIADEVVGLDVSSPFTPQILSRAQLGTQVIKREFDHGDPVSIVLSADPDQAACAFRYSPGPSPSTDRASGTWTKSAHWVDIILCILTSAAHADDGLELENYVAANGNYSSLPAGWGLGFPASRIDWDSFLEVRQATPDWRFPNFYLDDPVRATSLITQHFLRPLAAYFTTDNGNLGLRLPRVPLTGQSLTDWDLDVLQTVDDGAAGEITDLGTPRENLAAAVGVVVLTSRGPTGEDVTHVYRGSDFLSLYDQSGHYTEPDATIEIDLPSVRSSQAGIEAFLESVAFRRLFRGRFPPIDFEASTDLAQNGKVPGDLITVTHPDLPDLELGTRGWTAVVCELLGRSMVTSPSDEQGGDLGIRWSVTSFGPGLRAGRIAPAAHVASVASNTATCTANRYTESDAVGTLPATDAAAFAEDDVVKLLDVSGAELASGATQVVTGVSGNDVTLDGNFTAALAADTFLVYADRADAVSAQHTLHVYLADRVGLTVGASTDTPWRYAEG